MNLLSFALACLVLLPATPYPETPFPPESGTVVVSIKGVVTAPLGGPAQGVRVEARDAEGRLLASTESDEAGRFELKSLPVTPGTLRIEARADRGYFARRMVDVGAEQQGSTIEIELLLSRPRAAARPPAAPPPPPETAPPDEPPPVMVGSPGPGEKNYTRVTVHYATDRGVTGSVDPASFYAGDRSPGGSLSYGTLDVSIPRSHRSGELEAPSIWRLEFREDPERHVVLLRVGTQSRDVFFSELAARVARAPGREAFVFIHGYNVSFEDAARRTAQIAYDLRFDAAPILYSWPSAGSTPQYVRDEQNVEWSAPHLKEFLDDVSARSGAETVHLIAHSMGNRALARALEMIAMSGTEATPAPRPRFRQVVLAAPDIDADVFRQLAARLAATAERVTLYASANDEALKVSRSLHGYPRAGDAGGGIVVLPGIDTIDASNVATDFLGHSYYGGSPTVLLDLVRLLKQGVPPAARRLVRVPHGALEYWMLSP